MTKDITIIIPCLNEEQYLPKLLNDLCHQTIPNFQVIVVDAHSTDSTTNFAKSYQPCLKLTIIQSRQKNVAFQRNLGAKNARTDWIVFLDADANVEPNFIQTLLSTTNPTNTACFTTFVKPNPKKFFYSLLTLIANLGQKIASYTSIPECFGSIMIVNRHIFLQLKGFSTTTSFREDTEFVRKLVSHGYKFKVLTNLYTTISFRRFELYGSKPLLINFLTTYHKEFSQGFTTQLLPQYPMLGGKTYQPLSHPHHLNRHKRKIHQH